MDTELRGRVVAVSVGAVGEIVTGGRRMKSAIRKLPVEGAIRLGRFGLPGDEHVYHDHGGPDMAVLVYSADHYDHWREIGLDLPDVAAFGENFTVIGLTETEVCIGDVFEVGGAVVQVCQPRTPCHKLAARFGRKDLAVLVQDTGFTGYLLRVLQEGDVAAGDAMVLTDRLPDPITVAAASRIVNVDRNDHAGARRLLGIDALGASVRRALEARLDTAGELGPDTERLFGEG